MIDRIKRHFSFSLFLGVLEFVFGFAFLFYGIYAGYLVSAFGISQCLFILGSLSLCKLYKSFVTFFFLALLSYAFLFGCLFFLVFIWPGGILCFQR